MIEVKKPPVRLRFPSLWEELEDLKKRIQKLESKSDTFELLYEIRTMEELDELIKTIRAELQKYNVAFVTVEKHDE
ncbi:MAG: hypothetical protein JW840_09190 [Candidatus Thermoplasmatota archaeon]|nr:hypothetical protein [Candidatus Thermoplasmatota archaeon]